MYRISNYLLIQRNKKFEVQPRLFYSSELVNSLKSYTTCSKKLYTIRGLARYSEHSTATALNKFLQHFLYVLDP